ncbi:MAG: hypothetical protein R2706_06785 [Acidimicrobiales bacterium]
MIDDDDYELASAYCDGDVDAVQRARVEGDPALQLVVDEITQLRLHLADHADAALGANRLPPPEVKSAQLALAGDAFSELFASSEAMPAAHAEVSAGGHSASGASVIDLRDRKRYRLLTMAAGFIVVAGVGVMALNSLGGSSADTTSSADAIESADAGSSDQATLQAEGAATDTASDSSETNTTEAAADEPIASAVAEAPAEGERASVSPLDQPVPSYTFGPDESLADIVATIDDDGLAVTADEDQMNDPSSKSLGLSCAALAFPDDTIESAILITRGDQRLELAIVEAGTTTFAVTFESGCIESDRVALPDRG